MPRIPVGVYVFEGHALYLFRGEGSWISRNT